MNPATQESDRAGAAAPQRGRDNGGDRKGTDWQNRTLRGFISGTLTKKMGLSVESARNDSAERTYRITA